MVVVVSAWLCMWPVHWGPGVNPVWLLKTELCMCVRTPTHAHIHICKHKNIHIIMHIHVHIHIHIHIRIQIHIHLHIYIHIHTGAHSYTGSRARVTDPDTCTFLQKINMKIIHYASAFSSKWYVMVWSKWYVMVFVVRAWLYPILFDVGLVCGGYH